MRTWAMAAILCGSLLFCDQASANDVTFEKDVAPNEHVTGTIDIDNSSGDVNSISGEASGAVKGVYRLDGVNLQAEIAEPAGKLVINFNRRDQVVTAHLDPCTSPGNCTPGNPVPLWEKP